MEPNEDRRRDGPMRIVEASMELVDKDTEMVCPYNEFHVIRAKRLQYHLMKCRKNYTGNDMVKCPFNARHVIPRPEQRHHCRTCPDRVLIEPDAAYNTRMNSTNAYEGNISVPKYIQDRPPVWQSGEDWDDDIESSVQQYDFQYPASEADFNHQPQTNGYRLPQEPVAPSLRQPRRPPASVGQPLPMSIHPPVGLYHSAPQTAPGPTTATYQPAPGPPTATNQPNAWTAAGPPPATRQPPVPAQPPPPATSAPSWASVAGIGRGIQRTNPPVVVGAAPGIGRGATGTGKAVPGVGRGVVRPPPGFGRGQRGPTIAANIYNNVASAET